MIVAWKREILIITPFKCGSSSLGSLHEAIPYTFTVIGPANFYNMEHVTVHSPFIPIEYHDYHRVIICRDPYERAASMYFQHGKWTKKNNLPSIDLDTYIDTKLLPMDQNAPMLLPISKLYEISNWKEYWKLEDLDKHILEVFGVTTDRLNVSSDRLTLNEEQKVRLRPWAEQDCKNFNYEVF